jgi:hypothetical protein
VLEIRLDLVPSWRGGDLPRLVNARHSALHECLADRFARAPGWESAAEVSYSIWGERGVIDRLAFHAGRGMLAVFEIKADLSDSAGLVGQVDRYRRLAPEIARSRGWASARVSCWAVVADTDTNRRRLAAHRELLRGAFPADGRALGEWLRDPVERRRADLPRISAPGDWYAEPVHGQTGSGVSYRLVSGAWRSGDGVLRPSGRGRGPYQSVEVVLRLTGRGRGPFDQVGGRTGSQLGHPYIITRPPSTARTWPVM